VAEAKKIPVAKLLFALAAVVALAAAPWAIVTAYVMSSGNVDGGVATGILQKTNQH